VLRPYVRRLWMLQGDSAPEVEHVYPDGCPEWIFHFGDSFSLESDAGWVRQSPMLAAGQLNRPIRLLPGRRPATLGIRFLPHGMSAFMGLRQCELADSIVDLIDLGIPLAHEYRDRIAGAACDDDRFRLAEEFLLRISPRTVNPTVASIVHALESSRGQARIEGLAELSGLSRRQLERLFMHQTGLSPKRFARILRFQNALQIRASGSDWSTVAIESGYFDQAHLIADFREFTGASPQLHIDSIFG
jgi:AraC-like DNA-binding protein